jgi:hypothetical protein
MSIPGLSEIPPRLPVTDNLRAIMRLADGAADYELVCQPTPASSVRNPDGSAQPETMAERTRRITETVIMYVIENGLLVVPADIAAWLGNYFPAQRASVEGSRP